MQVRVRHIEQATGGDVLCSIHFTELEDLITFIKRSGGFYNDGYMHPFHSYQLVRDELGAYVEIIYGEEA